MEDLNKQQLILLVLLVSFVTSIATGIITVSLLDKAPVEVRQTINRVVERTVETVVPEDIEPQERVVTVRETVVVSQEDRVVEAISKNKGNIVRILNPDGSFVAIGVINGSDGSVVTVDGSYSVIIDYRVRLEGGEEFDLSFIDSDESGVSHFKIEGADREFTAGSFAANSLQLGQAIVAISGSNRNIVSSGLVSDLPGEGQIITNLNLAGMPPGTVLMNLSGDIVALLTRQGIFRSAERLLSLEPANSNTAAASQAVQ